MAASRQLGTPVSIGFSGTIRASSSCSRSTPTISSKGRRSVGWKLHSTQWTILPLVGCMGTERSSARSRRWRECRGASPASVCVSTTCASPPASFTDASSMPGCDTTKRSWTATRIGSSISTHPSLASEVSTSAITDSTIGSAAYRCSPGAASRSRDLRRHHGSSSNELRAP